MHDDELLKALHAADAVEAVDPTPEFLAEVAIQLLKRSLNDPDVSEIEKMDLRQVLINL